MKKMSQSDQRRVRSKYIQKGQYHSQEVKLNQLFVERRARNHRVTGRWLKAQMKHIMKKDLPEIDLQNKFKSRWLRAFCRRFKISWQKRTNKKNKGVMQRLNKVKRYHWWVIYQMGMETPNDMKIENQKKKKKKKTISKKKKKPKKKDTNSRKIHHYFKQISKKKQ